MSLMGPCFSVLRQPLLGSNRIRCLSFPKETDLSLYSQVHLNKVARQLDERHRKSLGFETPAEKFNACVASTG
jgi:IS30 family transposase